MSVIRSVVSVFSLLVAIALVFSLLVVVELVSALESPVLVECSVYQPVLVASSVQFQLPPALPVVAPPVVEVVVPICELTVSELRSLARSRGLRGFSRLRRPQLIELLS